MKKFFTLLTVAALTVAGASAQSLRPEVKNAKPARKSMLETRQNTLSSPLKEKKTTPGAGYISTKEKPANLLGVKSDNLAKKAPSKVSAKGGAILGGYQVYSDAMMYTDEMGIYDASNYQANIRYSDPAIAYLAEYGYSASPGAAYVRNGVVTAWGDITFWGVFILGSYYEQFDYATGELIGEPQLLNASFPWGAVVTYNPDDDCIYGYGYDAEGQEGFVKAPGDNPLNVELIYPFVYNADAFAAIAYNTSDKLFYAINYDGSLMSIDTKGNRQILKTKYQLGCTGFYPYVASMAYDDYDNTLYWNAQTTVGADLYMIDASSLAATKLFSYADGNEFTMLYAEPREVAADAPAAGEINSIDIKDPANTGTITFTLPAVALDGSDLAGTLEWTVAINGDEVLQGKGAPGEKVTQNLYALADGENIFQLVAYADGKQGASISDSHFVGYDTPMAPANVVLADGQVTWDAVTEGEHGGYLDAAGVTYQVYLNGEAQGKTVKTNKVKVEIPESTTMEGYEATVVAYANGLESLPGTSNKVVVGDPYSVPVTFAPTASENNVSITAGTGVEQWQFGDPGIGFDTWYVNYDELNDLDAWLFLPAISVTNTDIYYSVSLDSRIFSDDYPAEYFDICIGDAPSADAMKVLEEDINPTAEIGNYSALFSVDKAGTYYVGLHATSQKDMFGFLVWNVKIAETEYTKASPAAVSGLKVEAAPKGELKATATFTMPSKTMGGSAIDANTTVTAVVRSGEAQATVTGQPGQEMSVTIPAAQSTDDAATALSVYAKLGKLEGPAASKSTWVGLDMPTAPQITGYSISADNMSMTLTWEAPAAGANGGYYTTDGTYYMLVIAQGTSLYLWDGEEIHGNSGTLTLPKGTAQDLQIIGVTAYNEAGGGYCQYVQDFLGTPQYLPIDCDLEFGDTELNIFPGLDAYAIGGNEKWYVAPASALLDDDSLGGIVVYDRPGEAGAVGQFFMPVATTVQTTEASFSVMLYNDEDGVCPDVDVFVMTPDGNQAKLGTVDRDFEGFKEFIFGLPEEFQQLPAVQVVLQATFTSADQMLILRKLGMSNRKPNTTGVKDLSDLKLISGGKGVINFKGLEGRNVVVTRVDGARVAEGRLDGTSIAVEKGIYVVKAGDKTSKVIVK